jgi:hypothetical protein
MRTEEHGSVIRLLETLLRSYLHVLVRRRSSRYSQDATPRTSCRAGRCTGSVALLSYMGV